MFTARTLWEGRWPLLVLAAVTVVFFWVGLTGRGWSWVVGSVFAVLFAFTVSFFRDPERAVPTDLQAIVAPADGRIVEVRTVTEPDFLTGEAQMVAIFLSVFDVHVQRAPIAGEIKFVKYVPGKFLDARSSKCSGENENRIIGIEAPDGFRVTVRQIAGLIARRIVSWAGTGAKLARGERFGMIRFGSRVEISLPPGTAVLVKVGDYAKGGETILARKR
jgi:phosphatidylserine decarboxylase